RLRGGEGGEVAAAAGRAGGRRGGYAAPGLRDRRSSQLRRDPGPRRRARGGAGGRCRLRQAQVDEGPRRGRRGVAAGPRPFTQDKSHGKSATSFVFDAVITIFGTDTLEIPRCRVSRSTSFLSEGSG